MKKFLIIALILIPCIAFAAKRKRSSSFSAATTKENNQPLPAQDVNSVLQFTVNNWDKASPDITNTIMNLLHQGARPTTKLLVHACKFGAEEVVQYIVEQFQLSTTPANLNDQLAILQPALCELIMQEGDYPLTLKFIQLCCENQIPLPPLRHPNYLCHLANGHHLTNAEYVARTKKLRLLLAARWKDNKNNLVRLNPDVKNENSELCALHTAIKRNSLENVELLLNAHANPNLGAPYDQTPLYHAIEQNNQELILLLIRHGADLSTILPYNGHTANCAHRILQNYGPEFLKQCQQAAPSAHFSEICDEEAGINFPPELGNIVSDYATTPCEISDSEDTNPDTILC